MRSRQWPSARPSSDPGCIDGSFSKDPNQQVFWSTIQSAFSVLDTAEGNYTAAQQAELAAMSTDATAIRKINGSLRPVRMKQFGLYALAFGESQQLTGPMMAHRPGCE